MHNCSKCGKCHSYCPLYRHLLDERYAPRGKHHLLEEWTESKVLDAPLDHVIWSCLQCGACESLCPSGANVADTIRSIRGRLGARSMVRELLTSLRDTGKGNPFLMRLIKGLPVGAGLLSRLVKVTPWGIPPIPKKSFLELVPGHKGLSKRGGVSLFVGCVQNYLLSHIPLRAVENWGEQLSISRDQTCCGLPAWSSGLRDLAQDFARKNLKSLLEPGPEAILTLCSSCAYTIKTVWPTLFDKGSEDWHLAVDAAKRLVDMGEFFLSHKKGTGEAKVPCAIHLPCHERHSHGPKKIGLEDMGLEFSWDIKGVISSCCGQGGTFASKYPQLSKGIFKQALEEFEKSGAGVLVTNCSGCLLQWKMGTDTQSAPKGLVRVCHPIELI